MVRWVNHFKNVIADADSRGSRCLADANEASEAGNTAKAEKLYAKGQYWLDRSNKLRGNAMTALDTCAQAIAGVLWPAMPWNELGERDQNNCRNAARACLLSVLPVSDGAITALGWSSFGGGGRQFADNFASTIQHIVDEGE